MEGILYAGLLLIKNLGEVLIDKACIIRTSGAVGACSNNYDNTATDELLPAGRGDPANYKIQRSNFGEDNWDKGKNGIARLLTPQSTGLKMVVHEAQRFYTC